jgi:hypothetical protein
MFGEANEKELFCALILEIEKQGDEKVTMLAWRCFLKRKGYIREQQNEREYLMNITVKEGDKL